MVVKEYKLAELIEQKKKKKHDRETTCLANKTTAIATEVKSTDCAMWKGGDKQLAKTMRKWIISLR
jgi:hypothetical protein